MVGHLALFLKRFLGRRRIWCSKRSIEELELLEVSILDMTPAYVATSIETRGENTAMIEMRSEEARKTVVEDDTEERNNLIKQIKKFWRKINMNVKRNLKRIFNKNEISISRITRESRKMKFVQKNSN